MKNTLFTVVLTMVAAVASAQNVQKLFEAGHY